MSAREVQKALRQKADPKKAKVLRSFFKTGPGQYGEGDIFLGVTTVQTRQIAAEFSDLGFSEIQKLLKSSVHEHRVVAVRILVARYKKSDVRKQKQVFDFYIRNLARINNWDLVDLSAHSIVGPHLGKNKTSFLLGLAKSKDLWARRVGIVATLHYIRQGNVNEVFTVSEALLNDTQDLIHKATGWMLRETGKYCKAGLLESFLDKHATKMPRTMLRYAIERFPEKKRKTYLLIKKSG